MDIAGFDVATTSGIGICHGEDIRAYSFSARIKRPANLKLSQIDVGYEAALAEAWRAHVWALLRAEHITAVAFEEPRTVDYNQRKVIVDPSAVWAGDGVRVETGRSSSNASMIRAIVLCTHLVGVCDLMNIPHFSVTADDWRKAFIGISRAPKDLKGADKRRMWLKKKVRAQCELAGIAVPNDDAGDAAGVTWWLRGRLNPRLAGMHGDLVRRMA